MASRDNVQTELRNTRRPHKVACFRFPQNGLGRPAKNNPPVVEVVSHADTNGIAASKTTSQISER